MDRKTRHLENWGIISASAVSLFIAAYAFVAQHASLQGSVTVSLFLRFAIGFVIMFVPLLLTYRRRLFKDPSIHIIRAFFVVLGQLAFFFYLTKASLVNAVILYNTTPLFMPILNYLIYKRRFGLPLLCGLIVSFLGVIVTMKGGDRFSGYAFIGIVPGITIALSQILLHTATHKESKDGIVISLFNLYLYATIFSIIPVIFSGQISLITLAFTKKQFHIYMLMVISGFFVQLLRGVAYQLVRSPIIIAPYMYLSILFSGLLGWLVYHTKPNLYTYLGAALLLAGILIGSRKKLLNL